MTRRIFSYRIAVMAAIVSLGLCIMAHTELNAQTYNESAAIFLTTKDGLASNTTYIIDQDSKGYIWVGTKEGLCRYNGLTFDCFDQLANPEILEISIDNTDRIWVTALAIKPSYFKDGKFHQPILQDPELGTDMFGFTTDTSYVYVSQRQENFFKFKISNLNNPKIELSDKNEYYYKLFLQKGKINPFISSPLKKQFRRIINSSPYQQVKHKKNSRNFYTNKTQNTYYIQTHSGLRIINTVDSNKYNTQDLFKKTAIHDIFLDKDENLWISTGGKGLIFLPKNTTLLTMENSNLPEETIRQIVCNDRGDCALLTLAGQIIIKPRDSAKNNYALPIASKVSELHLEDDLLTAIDESRGFYQYSFTDHDLSLIPECKGVRSKTLEKSDSTTYYSYGVFAYKFDIEHKTCEELEPTQSRTYCAEDLDSSFTLLGTQTGLFLFDRTNGTLVKKVDTSLVDVINEIVKISSNRYAIATQRNGLRVYNYTGQSLLLDTVLDYSFSLNTLLLDNKVLWLGTNRGLLAIDIDDYSVMNWYGPKNGCIGQEIEGLAQTADYIYMNSESGIEIIAKSDSITKPIVPAIDLYSISSRGTPVAAESSLPYYNNEIEFQIRPILFNGDISHFEYTLVPEKGTEVKGRTTEETLTFRNLSSGTYTLNIRVVASNLVNSEWNEVTFAIDTPFWTQLKFIIPAFLILFLLGYFIWLDSTKRKNIKAELLQTKLSKLNAQLNPHSLFNNLQGLQYYINYEPDKAEQLLDSISQFLRNTLDISSQTYISFKDEIKYLKNFIELENQKRNNPIIYELSVDDKIDLNTKIPSMIIHPFVENAFQHAFNAEVNTGRIFIKFTSPSEDTILCSVVDNGSGYPLSPSSSKRTSYGNKIVNEKLNVIFEIYSPDDNSKNNFIEILDNSRTLSIFDHGTTVNIELPTMIEKHEWN